MSKDLAARIDALEERFTHQERIISDLNEVVMTQWDRIHLLERQLLRLRDEMQNMTPTREGPEPPPPHY